MKYKIENLIYNLKKEHNAESYMFHEEMSHIERSISACSFNDVQIRVQIALLHEAKMKALQSVIETVERWLQMDGEH